MFENTRDEQVAISYRFDKEDRYYGGITVPPRSKKRQTIMVEGAGVWIRGTGESGAVVFERRHEWKELPPGEPLKIVIE